jgi:protein-L-isoaspartate(D-aspartate) O-methyltransferase
MSISDDETKALRDAMVREVELMAADYARAQRASGGGLHGQAHKRGARSSRMLAPRVLAALRAVPRHLFVPPDLVSDAYLNRPLPIGYGQTISQPFIVALMTDLLDLAPSDRVLEIGTGSGYQTAILARLVDTVFTIEVVGPLAERAQRTFADLGLANIHTRIGDGSLGWPEAAPFDAILVAAAPAEIPAPLIEQLAPGGRLIIPVGGKAQQLILVEKQRDQSTVLREIIPVCFVPLTRHETSPD